jgi:NodT family efflux transporter outer membrane factor (OMF) lipoprotein
MKTRPVLAVALATLVACHTSPEHRQPEVQIPPQWSAPAAKAVQPPDAWWKEFGDETLDSLIQRAVAANPDLAIARARVREARAERDIAAGARLPEVDANAGFSRSQVSGNTAQGAAVGTSPRNLYTAGFDATWEVDLFGSNRAAAAAAQAGLEAAEEGRRDTLVTLLGEVARNYVDVRGFQREVTLTRENVEAQQRTLDLTRARFQAGLATQLDVSRAETQVSITAAQIPSLQAQTSAAIHRLSVLLGEPPASLEPELGADAPVPVAQRAIADLSAGLPSDLLRRRPDVRRAERELAQAAALTDEATADLYPKITLGASIGTAAMQAGDLGASASRTWSVGGSLFAPIFQGDRLRAAVRASDARQDAAVEGYRRTVLGALSEVEDALVAVSRERERHQSLADALASSRRALDLANDLQLRGLVDFFEVLDAQRSKLVAEISLARSETELTSQTVALYKALGGGWESLDPDGAKSEDTAAAGTPGS